MHELRIATKDDSHLFFVKDFDIETDDWLTTITATTSDDRGLKVMVQREHVKSIIVTDFDVSEYIGTIEVGMREPDRDLHIIDEGRVRVWEDGGIETVRSSLPTTTPLRNLGT